VQNGNRHLDTKGLETAMSVSFTATDTADYEAGVYRARLVDLETTEGSVVDDKTGRPRPYIKWTFELLEEGYEARTIRGNSSTNFGPQAKARAWAGALLGRTIAAGEQVGEDDLIGKDCDLMVTLEETDRGVFAKVDSVNPVRQRKTRAEDNFARGAEQPAVDKSDLDNIPI
jgi:hypothetical protein